ncbi:helix-turn-helix transcriptional regulator [Aestuariibius sp. 2305UL40-4]|uniref:helix-turn-helix transcriptional regulator n=1 Tax=Aestuariibius violaceus TaxID=3234132 RepID=UPI00345EE12B
MKLAFSSGVSVSEPGELGLIYEASIRGNLFEAIVDVISLKMPSCVVLLHGHDSVHPAGNFLFHRGLGADALRSYAVDLAQHDAWSEQHWSRKVGHIYYPDEFSPEDGEEDKYEAWLKNQGGCDCGVGLVLSRQATRQLILEVRFSKASEDKFRGQARRMLEELVPHMERALRIAELQRHASALGDEISSLLDMFFFPAFVIDEHCQVHRMNPRAETLLRDMNPAFLGSDNTLHIVEPEAEALLRGTLERMGRGSNRRTSLVPLRETQRQRRLFLSVTEISPTHMTTGCFSRIKSDTLFLVIAQDGSEHPELSQDVLWEAFGLTAKEAELAGSLLSGATLGEFAQRREVSKQTLRNQLVSIMRKTGTKRQTQLVTLLSHLALSMPA